MDRQALMPNQHVELAEKADEEQTKLSRAMNKNSFFVDLCFWCIPAFTGVFFGDYGLGGSSRLKLHFAA